MPQRKPPGFTSLELLLLIAVVLAMIGVLLAVLHGFRKNAALRHEAADLGAMHKACADYGAGNKGWLPGVLANGRYPTRPFVGKCYYAGTSVTDARTGAGAMVHRQNNYAMAALLENNGIAPDLLISRAETGATSHDTPRTMSPARPNTYHAWAQAGVGEVTHLHLSYALLQYAVPELKEEWKNGADPRAILAGTRLVFTAGSETVVPDRFSSVFSDPAGGLWKGCWVRGDGSTVLDTFDANDIGSAAHTPFANLRYGTLGVTPLRRDDAVVGIFGKSGAGMRNFGAADDKGQIGSANN